ncbi:hypothetical protein B296_00030951 [Ensete ventricosum]|uniref:Uncharacterized protein n=1 Tax=Ensete ventricosum TaxID=4639 RepID=A0A426ZM96_ENSVE|nr:hypothetical protein B296_00030951 [Ensete ventricosum]
MTVNDECKLKFLELKAQRSFRIESYEDFMHASLPTDECCYAIFDFDFVTDDNCQKS